MEVEITKQYPHCRAGFVTKNKARSKFSSPHPAPVLNADISPQPLSNDVLARVASPLTVLF